MNEFDSLVEIRMSLTNFYPSELLQNVSKSSELVPLNFFSVFWSDMNSVKVITFTVKVSRLDIETIKSARLSFGQKDVPAFVPAVAYCGVQLVEVPVAGRASWGNLFQI